ncbi:hypothetical protein ACQP1U_18775 [Actinomycetota bacterium]
MDSPKLHRPFVGVQHSVARPADIQHGCTYFTIRGESVDLGKVEQDSFIVAGKTDHITPWDACYQSCSMLGGTTEFVLSTSGHVAALVNPIDNPKASFLAGPTSDETTAEEWRADAPEHTGSWWTHYAAWLDKRSGRWKASSGLRAPASLGPAPGEYVHVR